MQADKCGAPTQAPEQTTKSLVLRSDSLPSPKKGDGGTQTIPLKRLNSLYPPYHLLLTTKKYLLLEKYPEQTRHLVCLTCLFSTVQIQENRAYCETCMKFYATPKDVAEYEDDYGVAIDIDDLVIHRHPVGL
jgi:hypothetical protein